MNQSDKSSSFNFNFCNQIMIKDKQDISYLILSKVGDQVAKKNWCDIVPNIKITYNEFFK